MHFPWGRLGPAAGFRGHCGQGGGESVGPFGSGCRRMRRLGGRKCNWRKLNRKRSRAGQMTETSQCSAVWRKLGRIELLQAVPTWQPPGWSRTTAHWSLAPMAELALRGVARAAWPSGHSGQRQGAVQAAGRNRRAEKPGLALRQRCGCGTCFRWVQEPDAARPARTEAEGSVAVQVCRPGRGYCQCDETGPSGPFPAVGGWAASEMKPGLESGRGQPLPTTGETWCLCRNGCRGEETWRVTLQMLRKTPLPRGDEGGSPQNCQD